MKRRNFLEKTLATSGALLVPGASVAAINHGAGKNEVPIYKNDHETVFDEVIIERPVSGQPHKGKVLAVIQPHCDDIPIFAGGTVAKLIDEGYTGYLIRTTNDDAAGSGKNYGEVVSNNEFDTEEVARVLGLKKTYHLNYRNHNMDENNIQEIKARMIFLIRMLKIDTVICYDPWAPYENNPDHYITGRALEAAITPAGSHLDYPEQLDLVKPHSVAERYFFTRRGPQYVNRIVDISKYIDKKVESNMVNVTQGPAGKNGSILRKKLAAEGKSLPILGNDDRTADFNYIKHFVLDIESPRLRFAPSDKKIGEKYGLEWAERFHYIGPLHSNQDDYITKNAVPLKK
jgi:LmbE family N-acetylglucosaminyl deacetylase